jgi:hypothetical protein
VATLGRAGNLHVDAPASHTGARDTHLRLPAGPEARPAGTDNQQIRSSIGSVFAGHCA